MKKLIYKHIAYSLKMATSQDPHKVYDVSEVEGAAGKFHALTSSGGITIWDSWEELKAAYPHVTRNNY